MSAIVPPVPIRPVFVFVFHLYLLHLAIVLFLYSSSYQIAIRLIITPSYVLTSIDVQIVL